MSWRMLDRPGKCQLDAYSLDSKIFLIDFVTWGLSSRQGLL